MKLVSYDVPLWAGPCDGETVRFSMIEGSPFSLLPPTLVRSGAMYARNDYFMNYVAIGQAPPIAPPDFLE